MRQIHIQVPAGKGDRVLEIARDHDGVIDAVRFSATGKNGDEKEMIFATVVNEATGHFFDSIAEEVEELSYVLLPTGSIPLEAPAYKVGQHIQKVTQRSTLEVVVAALQSIGAWKGLILYAVLSGLVAAYAVLFNLPWLLTAAMLIAPMGAPAMVCAIGASIGSGHMVARGALRFWIAIAVLAAVAAVLGYAMGAKVSTATMETISSLSAWALMLALGGGAAGAQAQIRSSRDSLVSGTATGFLVAVALSPPSAVLGLAAQMGRWDYVAEMALNLALTFSGIIVGGWLSLFVFGLRPSDVSGRRGGAGMSALLVGGAMLLHAGLVVLQLQLGPSYRKADLSSRAVIITRDVLQKVPQARLIEASSHFTRRDLTGEEESLLVNLTVTRQGEIPLDSVRATVRRAVIDGLRSRLPPIVPYVDVTVLEEQR